MALLAGPVFAADQAPIHVTIDKAIISTRLGDSTAIAVRVANLGVMPSPPMTAHLSIVDPLMGRPVDPEDWTDRLSRQIGSLAAGRSVTLEWTLKPIAQGQYALFVAVVPTAPRVGDMPLTSPAINVSVGPPATNSTGATMVVVAVVVPVVIGAVLAGQSILNRPRRSPPARH
jgi:hypothetical protein